VAMREKAKTQCLDLETAITTWRSECCHTCR
jgi:hypothetical protein